jgi:hypothetical protein
MRKAYKIYENMIVYGTIFPNRVLFMTITYSILLKKVKGNNFV